MGSSFGKGVLIPCPTGCICEMLTTYMPGCAIDCKNVEDILFYTHLRARQYLINSIPLLSSQSLRNNKLFSKKKEKAVHIEHICLLTFQGDFSMQDVKQYVHYSTSLTVGMGIFKVETADNVQKYKTGSFAKHKAE